jgi:hypothetical protein
VIGYFDTSAFVPLLIAEPSSGLCRRLWDDADVVVTTSAVLCRGCRRTRASAAIEAAHAEEPLGSGAYPRSDVG